MAVMFLLGKRLLNKKNFQKSIVYFNECLKIDDEIAFAWMYGAMDLSKLGRDEEVDECFKKAIELDKDTIKVLDGVHVNEG